MSFIVSRECRDLGLRAGAIVFRQVHIQNASPVLRSEIAHEVEAIRARLVDQAGVASLPELAAFHAILRAVGAKPHRLPPSVDRLLSLGIERGHLHAVNNLVDAYNLVSLRSLCSLGAHDLDRLALPVTLRLLTGQETFTPLGRDSAERVIPGEFGYVDARQRVLCRLDVRQAEFSKVTAGTSNVLLIIEATADHEPEKVRQVFDEVIETVTRHCGGSGEVVALA